MPNFLRANSIEMASIAATKTGAGANALAKRCVLLFRHTDLRVHDNLCLKRALELNVPLLPVFCFDPRYFGAKPTRYGNRRMSAKRSRFTIESVEDLRNNLRKQGLPLYVSLETPEKALEAVCNPTSDDSKTIVITSKEPCSEEVRVDSRVRRILETKLNGSLETIWQRTMYHPDDLPAKGTIERLPLKFTPWRQVVENAKTPVRVPWSMSPNVAALTWPEEWLNRSSKGFAFLPTLGDLGHDDSGLDEGEDGGVMSDLEEGRFKGGESVALKRLKDWIWKDDCLAKYKETRNGMLGSSYSSKFSPWLAVGCLSPRTIYAECKRYERERVKNKSTYWLVFELLWRDFFQFQAVKQGNHIFLVEGPLGRTDRNYSREWPGSKSALERWKNGTTGWPLVDANMRELNATGFMSNRGRQNVASFLTLEQRVDWRHGADYFEMHLLDHDVASNYGNWCAAAGLFGGRVNRFNILKQSNDYDKSGEYVKRWIPELRDVPTQKVHAPWKMSKDEMKRSNCQIGQDYPEPLPSICEWNNKQSMSKKGQKDYGGSKKNNRYNSNKNGRGKKKFRPPSSFKGGNIGHL